MSFLFGSKKSTNILIVDISAGSTAAGLVSVKGKNEVPEIIARTRTALDQGGEVAPDVLERAMFNSLRGTLSRIVELKSQIKSKDYSGSIEKAVVTFSSPWVDSYLKTVSISKEEGFVFDRKALLNVIDEEKELFKSRLTEHFEEESDIFESAVMDLYLNGYIATETSKEKIKEAEVSFILSATTKSFLRKVEDEFIKTVGLKSGIIFHSFMHVYYKVLSHSFRNLQSALLINMTAKVSDLLFFHHGGGAINASLPFGPASLAKAVAEKMKIPKEVAYSHLTLFAGQYLDQETTATIDSIITEKEVEWAQNWKEVSTEIKEDTKIPYSIFLIVPFGLGRLMKTFLENIFPERNIMVVGETNTFTKELVRGGAENLSDEKILLLSSFSNLMI